MLVPKANAKEQCRKDDEAGHLDGLAADGINQKHGDLVAGNVAGDRQKEVANGYVV